MTGVGIKTGWKSFIEDKVMSRPLPRRMRLWTYGPLPEEERGDHLAAVLGERRFQRLMSTAYIALLIGWPCGLVYELSEPPIRTAAAVVGISSLLLVLRTLLIVRSALHQPSRTHQWPGHTG